MMPGTLLGSRGQMRREGYSLRGLTTGMEAKLRMAARGVLQVLILKYRGKSTRKGKEEFLEEVTDKWGPGG